MGDRTWIDGLHFGSEVPGYYTRYLGTVTAHLGILVTYSIHADNFERYDVLFSESVARLMTQQRASAFD